MAAELDTQARGAMCIEITGAVAATDGGIGAILNPEGVDLLITRTTLYVETNSTGAANLSMGIGATATSSATDIINALAMAAAAGKAYNGATIQGTTKTEITVPAIWQDNYYLIFTGSADTTGLTAKLFVEYVRLG